MAARRRILAATAAAAVLVLGPALPAQAASPMCGRVPLESPDGKPVRADLTPTVAAHVVDLGMGVTWTRKWQVEFGWTADCTLVASNIQPRMTPLQGADRSVDGRRIGAVATVDNDARRVTVDLDVPREHDAVPPGKFEGTLEVGDGTVGLGKATVTVRHQEPVVLNSLSGFEQFAWIVGLGLITSALFANSKLPVVGRPDARNAQDFTTPVAVLVGGLALYPLLASLGQAKRVPAPAWPIWLGVAGLGGGFILGVLKHRSASNRPLAGGHRFAAAMFISFGAGITVWRSQYLNSPDWALTLEAALGLVGVVGGTTATSALLLLNPDGREPPPKPSDS